MIYIDGIRVHAYFNIEIDVSLLIHKIIDPTNQTVSSNEPCNIDYISERVTFYITLFILYVLIIRMLALWQSLNIYVYLCRTRYTETKLVGILMFPFHTPARAVFFWVPI